MLSPSFVLPPVPCLQIYLYIWIKCRDSPHALEFIAANPAGVNVDFICTDHGDSDTPSESSARNGKIICSFTGRNPWKPRFDNQQHYNKSNKLAFSASNPSGIRGAGGSLLLHRECAPAQLWFCCVWVHPPASPGKENSCTELTIYKPIVLARLIHGENMLLYSCLELHNCVCPNVPDSQ